MNPLTAIIVDDEPLAREGIRILLKTEPDIRLTGEAGDGIAAQRMISELHPDILFLDIQMPGLDGFGLLSSLPFDRRPIVIFITAFDRFALDAFAVHAVDYLLKPVDPERFRDAVGRAREQVRLRSGGAPDNVLGLLRDIAARQAFPERLMIRSSGKVSFILTADIRFIEADGDYCRIHAKGERHMLHEPLQDLANRLDPRKFIRIHRSTIVNSGHIRELQPLFRGDYAVILNDGTRLTLSRRYREQAMALLQ